MKKRVKKSLHGRKRVGELESERRVAQERTRQDLSLANYFAIIKGN